MATNIIDLPGGWAASWRLYTPRGYPPLHDG